LVAEDFVDWPMLRAKARRTNSREVIGDYIREKIFTGEYAPFTRIPQDEVAAAVGFTRIPVREALVSLEADGFVSVEAHRGAFVKPYSSDDIRCHFELRGYVAGIVARRAALARSEELVRDLERVWKVLGKSQDPTEFKNLTDAFFSRIEHVGGSPLLTAAQDRFHEMVPGNIYAVVPDALEVARRTFAEVLAAQRQFDADAAMANAVSACLALAECLIKLFASRNQLVD
jgi:DNA-binding GntR family transcriptional regulator